ncbi:uncharacterized protein LOC110857339 [Folsomia candida]|uniref:Uncharacterized protein n=1 Tax=Folsomia candida TaxID=158441 RepID=A0A226DIS7_FOLCA|nr:uncharacterized protein LOC110857339 [Folsomia candida]OXA44888.1 hypothetical protein Fcan01_20097 [Folsomia candida]
MSERSAMLQQRRIDTAEIRFNSCTFTFTDLATSSAPSGSDRNVSKVDKKPSTFTKIVNKGRDRLEVLTRHMDHIAEGRVPEKRLQSCIFPPERKLDIKNYIAQLPSKPKLVFVSCNFVHRQPTLCEIIYGWIVKNICGGGSFELNHYCDDTYVIEVEDKTYLLHDLSSIVANIMAKIQGSLDV